MVFRALGDELLYAQRDRQSGVTGRDRPAGNRAGSPPAIVKGVYSLCLALAQEAAAVTPRTAVPLALEPVFLRPLFGSGGACRSCRIPVQRRLPVGGEQVATKTKGSKTKGSNQVTQG